MFHAAHPEVLPSSPSPLQSADILKGASLPLVAVICPMALQDPGDDPVEVGRVPAVPYMEQCGLELVCQRCRAAG